MIEFDASGLAAAVTQTVDQVRDAVGESTLRKVGVTGAAIFRDEAKQNASAHVKTGVLRDNIIMKRVEEESDGANRQVYIVTVRKGRYGGGDAYYSLWVERGHKIVRRKPRGTTWRAHRAAQELEFGGPRVQAYPYMRPAYDSKRTSAIDAMTRTLAEQLQRNASHDH